MGRLLKALTGGLGSVAGKAYEAHVARKTRKDEFENAVHLKKLENVEQGKINEAEWNHSSIKRAGWRPGYLTVLFTVPLILVFFPWFVPHIETGFAVLDTLPEWYRWSVSVVVGSGFGYKAIADAFMKKKYE